MGQLLTTEEWHQRFSQQASWTKAARDYLLYQFTITPLTRILEVGCGTGVITGELNLQTPANIFGVDLKIQSLRYANHQDQMSFYTCGDAFSLPFPDQTFDITLCHFFLLWLKSVEQGISEMCRVTRSNGIIAALAEPDYGGRLDYPPELIKLGVFQEEALKHQGADTRIGRKLGFLFHQAAIRDVRVGLLGGEWGRPLPEQYIASEWTVLENDLREDISLQELREMQNLDLTAWQKGERILYIPTFYAWGNTP
jgi:ubiquinone/menaquinone biosynthesis C-methylase UbiE